ncbi:HNH endonuclease [Salmonella enterica]|nr:HNH endonuclease [Salmonella enterica]
MKEFLENYTIYEDGKVQRTNSDNNMCAPSYVGRFLTPETTKKGYQRVTLCRHGKTKRFQLHRLIALVHLPNPDNLPCVNHKDGNKQNNHVTNLEWCSYSENEQHSYDKLNKIASRGDEHYQAKLTEEIVREIRTIIDPPFTKLAKEFGVNKSTIQDAYYKRTWKHVI